MITLHMDNCTTKAYLCNHDGTVSIFSRLATTYCIWPTGTVLLCSSIIPIHLCVEVEYLLWGKLVTECYLIIQAAFSLWIQPEVDFLES